MNAPFDMPRVLAWEVTRRCPLKCRHCRAAAADLAYARELDTAECLRVVDSLAGERAPMVIWTGGEPMLRDDVDELVRHATTRGLRSVMAPCGMLVTEARLAALKDAGVMACSFSLDGPDAASHDAFRGVAGAYGHVVEAMRVAKSIDLPFQVNVTVSTLNLHRLDAIHARAVELGATKLDVFFLVTVGRGKGLAEYALSEAQTRQALEWCFRKALEGPLAIKETCCPAALAQWRRFADLHGVDPARHRPCGCLGGRGFAFLSHTGELQTCGFVDEPCGNIRDFGCDFRALVRAAANPLGLSGNCRARD